MVICGIDPGMKGGVVIRRPSVIIDYKMPIIDKLVHVGKIQEWLIHYNVDVVYIEEQRAKGRQAHQHIIGVNYGRLTATIELCGVRYVEVPPKVWQKKIFGRNVGKQSKEYSINFCLENGLFVPMTSSRADAKYHDGIADAHCIAVYGASEETAV